jgi:putative transposase
VSRACRLVKVGRTKWYRPSPPLHERDAEVIGRLNEVVGRHGRWGFWKCFHWLRQRGCRWNHKRVLRVYRAMKLNRNRISNPSGCGAD